MHIQENQFSLGIPILLIDSPMVELKLDENNEMVINEIDSCIINFKNQINGIDNDFFIPIIKKDFFKEFCLNFNSISDEIIDFLIKNPNYQLKNYEKTEFKIKENKIYLKMVKKNRVKN